MVAKEGYVSWGRFPRASHLQIHKLRFRSQRLPTTQYPLLPFGNGRSYGDSCLNNGADLIDGRSLNHFIQFDPTTGQLRCEAGVLLADILHFTVGRGWFLPVTPGTRFITVGGAIANDVHGKNHHRSGTISHHIIQFELLRSDNQRWICSPYQNSELFCATVGGLGLTGLITWVDMQLKPINNPFVRTETIQMTSLDHFFTLAAESDRDYEYTVAWLDCLTGGKSLGRGLFMRGNHAAPLSEHPRHTPGRSLSVPLTPPFSLVGGLPLRLFNALYYRKQLGRQRSALQYYEPFFYPLDGIGHWNRIYGPKGFLQYQCVIPMQDGPFAIREILARIARSGQGSFLSVLKVFGDKPSLGLLSFPRSGVTLALDFPNQGLKTFTLLDQLDQVVAQAGGAVYPAKDASMSPDHFQSYYPNHKQFQSFIDPHFSSSFWRRVMGEETT
jgi:FAD/FMN-containing dehydrogenase